VHRDLKPENILFLNSSPDSPIVIADFGIAKVLEGEEATAMEKAGTLAYLAPEILKKQPYGLKVDVWSIGWGHLSPS
jgi:calcium/calmodulin-dependent protein kinase I